MNQIQTKKIGILDGMGAFAGARFFHESIFFTVGVHGDEHLPVNAVKTILPMSSYLICHPRALKKQIRFIETDLNRSFPGNPNGFLEERIAFELTSKLKNLDQVVDIHTATCSTPPFIVMTKTTTKHYDLAIKTGVNRIVVMSQEFGAGKSLIDFVPVGISLESGRENSKKTSDIIQRVILRFQNKEKSRYLPRVYEVCSVLKKSSSKEYLLPHIKSFKLVSSGSIITNYGRIADFNFYPVLARSKNYPDFLCLMAKKITLPIINVKISSSI